MGANSDLFFRMSEREYLDFPQEVRETYLSSKLSGSDLHDHTELMQDETYQKFYLDYKKAKINLEDYRFILREKKRNTKQ
jgi:hypothetical protein